MNTRGHLSIFTLTCIMTAFSCEALASVAHAQKANIVSAEEPATSVIAPAVNQTLTETAPTKATISLADQRYSYEMAKTALAKGNQTLFEQHYALLDDYPLTPYLDYGVLKRDLGALNFAALDNFFTQHDGSYLETRLRHQLLYTLAIKKRWAEFLNYYQADKSTSELECYWLNARATQGDNSALEEVDSLWPKGRSHPKACDPLFERWRKAGRLTQEIAWQRFNNAMQAKNRGLARYLTRFMDEKYSGYAELYLKVHGYPYQIRSQRLFSEQSLPMQQIIVHGIKRYARKNPKDAMRLWELYEAQQLFPTELSSEAKLEITTRLIRNDEPELAEQIIANSHELQKQHVVEALIRQALSYQNWGKVLQWVNALDAEPREMDRWQYWRARALAELGMVDANYGSPEQIYLSIAGNRSFYGFLASDRVNKNYSLQHEPVEISPTTIASVEHRAGIQRARELWLKNDLPEAQAEWIFTMRQLDTDSLVAAGELARRWGWYNKGIYTMISGNLWNHLSIRFPLAYEDAVIEASAKTSVTPDFIYAVARQESAFAEKARSSAGAMGLMQLMPATARTTAARNGIKMKIKDLYDPEHNIQLGGLYLNELLEKYNGNRILAAAAYNAGPHRVARWMGDNPERLPYDIWIETIPFKETRGYVQNVLAFSVIYGYRLGQPRNLVTEQEANNPL